MIPANAALTKPFIDKIREGLEGSDSRKSFKTIIHSCLDLPEVQQFIADNPGGAWMIVRPLADAFHHVMYNLVVTDDYYGERQRRLDGLDEVIQPVIKYGQHRE